MMKYYKLNQEKDNYNNCIEPILEVKEKPITQKCKSKPAGKWESKIDWKDAKNEIIFKKEYERFKFLIQLNESKFS